MPTAIVYSTVVFLGMENVGPIDRPEFLPTGRPLRQADETAWMAFFVLNISNLAPELAKHNPTNEDIASKFSEHFLFNRRCDDFPERWFWPRTAFALERR